MVTNLIPSFNGGELSPFIHLRSDLDKYRSGCRTLRNMLITPYGPARRRPGLEFIHSTKGNAVTRLETFQYSVGDTYVLAFSDQAIQVYKDGTFVDDGGGSPYEISAGGNGDIVPWTEDQIFEIQMRQVNNFLYLVHPDHPPHLLYRRADDDWTLEELTWDWPALLDENTKLDLTITVDFPTVSGLPAWSSASVSYTAGDKVSYNPGSGTKNWVCMKTHTSTAGNPPGTGTFTETVIKSSGKFRTITTVTRDLWIEVTRDDSAPVGTVVTLESVEDVFYAGHVDSYWELAKERGEDENEVSIALTATDVTSSTLIIQGGWQVSTFGTWSGTLQLERSFDSGNTWKVIRTWAAEDDRNVSAEGFEVDRCIMRLVWVDDGTTGADHRAVLESTEAFVRGIVKITAVTDANNATAVVVRPVERMTTSYWSEGAWSDYRGFPRTVCAHEQRIVYGGNADFPQRIWGSKLDDYENFRRGTEASDSFAFDLVSREQNPICWMLSQKALLIGTTGGEWAVSASKDEEVISPTNVRARRHASHGSIYQQGHLVNDAAIFVQRGGRKVREMVYSFENDGYVTQDLTILAEHITSGGVVQSAFQGQRDATLWTVTGAGELCGMSYERGQNIAGWHRHTTGRGPSQNQFEGTPFSVLFTENFIVITVTGDEYLPSPGDTVELSGWGSITLISGGPLTVPDGTYTVAQSQVTGGAMVFSIAQDPADPIWTGSGTDVATAGYGTCLFDTSDKFESVAVVSTPGEDDEVWVVTRRQVGGTFVRFIERFTPDSVRTETDDKADEFFYLDAGVKATATAGSALTTLSGLDHLEGETVQVVADGSVLADRVVSSGAISLGTAATDPVTATTLIAGLAYDSVLEPMPMEIGLQNGTSTGRDRRIHEVCVWFLNTAAAKVGSTVDGSFDEINFRTPEDDPEEQVPLYSGPKIVHPPGGSDLRASFVLKSDQPLPMTIAAVVPKINYHGDSR